MRSASPKLEKGLGGHVQAQLHPGATPQQVKVSQSLKVKFAATCKL